MFGVGERRVSLAKVAALQRRLARRAVDADDPAVFVGNQTPLVLAGDGLRIDFAQVPLDRDVAAIFDEVLQRARKLVLAAGRAPVIADDGIADGAAGKQQLLLFSALTCGMP